jgi:MFS family permease
MAIGMVMATTVTGLVDLSIWRIVTGLGIGGMLAAINAVAAEFSNTRRRHLSVSLMSIGYPLGAVVGGIVAAQLLRGNEWRAVFYFGASVTAVLIPVVFFIVPESVHWLARKQPKGALEWINHTLARMGHAPAAALPSMPADVRTRSIADIFAPGLVATTAIVTIAYFFHITTFYFIVKWVPKIVVDLGFAASSAAGVLVWANVGGATGGAVFGLLTQRYGVKQLTIGVLFLSTVMVMLFGRTPPDLQQLSFICALAGFCTNAGIVGLYAILAQVFPTHVRAFGTGFTVGVGRGGSVLAPILAGFLFAAGYSLSTTAFTLALGSTLAAGVLLLLRLETDRPVAEREERRVGSTPIPAASRAQS